MLGRYDVGNGGKLNVVRLALGADEAEPFLGDDHGEESVFAS